jgi:molybdopterin synthase catalytic subunit
MALSGDEKTVLIPPISPPKQGNDWCALTEDSLPVGAIYDWCVQPQCGAIVVFSGVVRDHAEHRTGVTLIEYEAYESQVVPRLEIIAAELRRQWPDAGRVAILHRVGPLALGESSVVVGVSTPHRHSAFSAAEFGIDSLKATVPIWKREFWDGGSDWGLAATAITEANLLTPPNSSSNAANSQKTPQTNSAGHLS